MQPHLAHWIINALEPKWLMPCPSDGTIVIEPVDGFLDLVAKIMDEMHDCFFLLLFRGLAAHPYKERTALSVLPGAVVSP
jgi:hypothetical protein